MIVHTLLLLVLVFGDSAKQGGYIIIIVTYTLVQPCTSNYLTIAHQSQACDIIS
jgi:hypothetical protein